MEIVAVAIGAGWGYWCLRSSIKHILDLYYCSLLLDKYKFDVIYDAAGEKINYQLFIDITGTIKSYADYLRLHRDAKVTSYQRFRSIHSALANIIFLRTLPYVILPAVFFWSYWYFYLLGVVSVFWALIAYKFYVKGYRIGLYQRALIYTIFSLYIHDTHANNIHKPGK